MKKILNLTLIAFLTLSSIKAQARVYSADEVKVNISNKVIESYKKYTDADLEVKVLAVPFQTLQLPSGEASFEVTSPVDKFLPRDLKKVNVRVDGNLIKTFNAPVEVRAYKEVLVASGFINRDQFLNSNFVVTKKAEVSANMEYILTPDMLSREIIAKKTFKEGEVIDKRFVKFKPDVRRNEEVTAFLKQDNLTISIDVVALSDGMTGDYIGVENKSCKKVFTAKIIGENKVLIEI